MPLVCNAIAMNFIQLSTFKAGPAAKSLARAPTCVADHFLLCWVCVEGLLGEGKLKGEQLIDWRCAQVWHHYRCSTGDHGQFVKL